MSALPALRFVIDHPGVVATSSLRMRRRFQEQARRAALAAAGLERWPHRPNATSRVAEVHLIVRPPARMGFKDESHPTLGALVYALGTVLFDRIAKTSVMPIVSKDRAPIAVELRAITVEVIPDPAERAAAAARVETSTPRPMLGPGELTPAEEYARAGIRIAPPEDWIERQLDEAEAAERRTTAEDPNAVSAATLQRETPLAGGHSSTKGRRRARMAPAPTAVEIAERFDRQSRDLDMQHLTDVERAEEALARNALRVGRSGAGRPLKGASPRVAVSRVPADLLVACAPLGDNVEMILAATARALASGALYAPPSQADVA